MSSHRCLWHLELTIKSANRLSVREEFGWVEEVELG
jgi:hypothetical protein